MEIKILLVDDSNLVRTKVKKLLEEDSEYHFFIQICEDGEKALRHLCACDEEDFPDLIILDRNMPNMTGDECIRVLKKDEHWRSIPILLLTAQKETSEIVHGLLDLKADDYLPKPFDDREMLARVKVLVRVRLAEAKTRALLKEMETAHQSIYHLNQDLEKANLFIRKTFGRYLSDEIVQVLLSSPEGLTLGGEKRKVTIMMADLRGFTRLSETLPAENVVQMINNYLDVMTEIIFKYQGTIDEFLGDAVLAIFGAPTMRPDDAKRSVACALEMQLGMERVNQYNDKMGYPQVSMGIGLHTGNVVVGNTGSQKRMKYGVVGGDVNLASRIESYTIGGQILISESTLRECEGLLCIDRQIQVIPKGFTSAITLSEIDGIRGEFQVYLPEKTSHFFDLETELAVQFFILSEKNVEPEKYQGFLTKIGNNCAEMESIISIDAFSNLKLEVENPLEKNIYSEMYAKVTEVLSFSPPRVLFTFTSLPKEAQKFFAQFSKEKTTSEVVRKIKEV